MLTFDGIMSYASAEGDFLSFSYPYPASSFQIRKPYEPSEAQRVPRTTHAGSYLRPSNTMVTFLEPPSTKSQSFDSLYHLEQPVSMSEDDEYRQEESADHLLAFHNTLGNHTGYR